MSGMHKSCLGLLYRREDALDKDSTEILGFVLYICSSMECLQMYSKN